MVYGVIYKISNSINNKIYIGQTKSNPPSCRWNRHKYSVNKGCNVPIHNAMRLYGIEKFTFEVLHFCETLEEINSKEIEFISSYNTICPNGYNIMKGGDNFERTEEHKRKISDALRNKKKTPEHIEKMKISRKGKGRGPFTEEHKQKISKANIGKKKPQSVEHREKINKALTGKKRSIETIEKMRQARKLYWEKKKSRSII
jgi:group I intron endonuclease